MASISIAIFSVCLLTFVNSGPATNRDIELQVPEKCKGLDFCSEIPANYERIQERINSLIPIDMTTSVQDRQGIEGVKGYSSKTDWQNCPTREYMTKPTFARDPISTDNYHVLVQTDKFEQTFLAVECPAKQISDMISKVKHQCFPDLFTEQNVNTGMHSKCIKRYSSRLLYIYDHDKDELVMKPYKIPILCSCKIMD